MKEVLKMEPLTFSHENSGDGILDLIVSDTNSINIPILLESTAVEESYSSKVIEVLGKNLSYFIATSGNIAGQMIISTTVAQTPWSKENVVNSLLFSGWLIALDTLSEPHIFSAVAKIKNWMIDKWKNNENDINLKKELIKVSTILLALSYAGVLLDRASNSLLNNWFSVEIVEQTGIEFVSYVLNSTFHGAMISMLEQGIKLSWRKWKNLFNRNNNDVESQSLLENQQDSNEEIEENSNFNCKTLLQLSVITPISMFITWATEDFISNQEFSLNKMITDAPKVIGGITLSLCSSLLNCMVNKEEIPFLPTMSTIKKWCFYKNDINTNNDLETYYDVYSIDSNKEFHTPNGSVTNEYSINNDDFQEEFYNVYSTDSSEEQLSENSSIFDSDSINNYGTFETVLPLKCSTSGLVVV